MYPPVPVSCALPLRLNYESDPNTMLTIGTPGATAFLAYLIIIGLIWRTIAFSLSNRNPNSAVAKAMHFIY